MRSNGFTRRRFRTPAYACAVLGACALSVVGCDRDGGGDGPVEATLLTAISGEDGTPDWTLRYEDCLLAEVRFLRRPAADLRPRAYREPYDFLSHPRAITFAYRERLLVGLTLFDSLGGGLRERPYEVRYEGERVSGLAPQQAFLDGVPSASRSQAVDFFYDALGRVDSISESSGGSTVYTYDEADAIARASYRTRVGGRATEEYYSYLPTANPLAGLPLRYVMPYALFWSARLPAVASFELRQYSYAPPAAPGGAGVFTDLTYGDPPGVSTFEFQSAPCTP